MKDINILINNGINVQQSIELFGDIEMYDETLSDFLDMINEKLTHLENYKISDMPNYAIDVHSLKSDSRYLGFTTLADLSYESEMKSKAGDINFVLENHPKIIAEARRIISVAQKYLGRDIVDLIPNIGGNENVEQLNNTNETSQPLDFVQTPAIQENINQTSITQSNEPTIEFFTPEVDNQNDIMNQALYNMNQAAQAPVSGIKKGIILVIDDSNLVANFVKKIFNQEYDVLIANDGIKGIEIINDPNVKSKVKACLLDLNMPNMNGLQVMDYFYQNGIFVKIPVVVISGTEDIELIDKANSYPIIDILAKPFTDRDVQNVVEKCLAAYF